MFQQISKRLFYYTVFICINALIVKSSSGTVTYIQNGDSLEIKLKNLSLEGALDPNEKKDSFCVSTNSAFFTGEPSFSLINTESDWFYDLHNLEIYFLPTSQYIGVDMKGYANIPLISDYENVTLSDYTRIPLLSEGFTEICFANSCTHEFNIYGCTDSTTYNGYLILRNVRLFEFPTLNPTLFPSTLTPSTFPTTLKPSTLPTTLTPSTLPTTRNPSTLPTTLNPSTLPTTLNPTRFPTTVNPSPMPTQRLTSNPSTLATMTSTSYLSSSGSISYSQFNKYLEITLNNVTLASNENKVSLCLSVSPANIIGVPSFSLNIMESVWYHDLHDLEIYFLPTNQYIGFDTKGYANIPLITDYENVSLSDKTDIPLLSEGFTEICFANSCAHGLNTDGCSDSNTYNGNLLLYNIRLSSSTDIPTLDPTTFPTLNPSSGSIIYNQYNDNLEIILENVTLASNENKVSLCLSVSPASIIGVPSFSLNIIESVWYHDLHDLEIYFLPTNQYIGFDTKGYANIPLITDYENVSLSDKTDIPLLSEGFTEICFANSCAHGLNTDGCSDSNTYNGNLLLYNIRLSSSTDIPTLDPTTFSTLNPSSGSIIYNQYNDNLEIILENVTLASNENKVSLCLSVSPASIIGVPSFSLNIIESVWYHDLHDLEIYFLPTNQYIGFDTKGYANISLVNDYESVSLSEPTKIESLSEGFTEICFANSCAHGLNIDGCSDSNTYNGILTLYNVSLQGSITYNQYNDYLEINLVNVNLASNDMKDSLCVSMNPAEFVGIPSFSLEISESIWYHDLHDLEIYFLPTSQYLGFDTKGYANISLVNDYENVTLSDITRIPLLSEGFTEICFANSCAHGLNADGCTDTNTYNGKLILYNVQALAVTPSQKPTTYTSPKPTSYTSPKPTHVKHLVEIDCSKTPYCTGNYDVAGWSTTDQCSGYNEFLHNICGSGNYCDFVPTISPTSFYTTTFLSSNIRGNEVAITSIQENNERNVDESPSVSSQSESRLKSITFEQYDLLEEACLASPYCTDNNNVEFANDAENQFLHYFKQLCLKQDYCQPQAIH